MSDRKFFSGLPDGMMGRSRNAPNRQQTNFYWPNETDTEQFVPTRNRLRNRTMSNASLMSQSQASTDTEESRRRKSQQNQSKIEFYDMVDVGTDNESVYSRSNDPTKHRKQETLKSRIEFYDFVDTTSPQPEDDVQSVIERPVKTNPEPSVNEQKIQPTTENGQKEDEQIKTQTKSEHRRSDSEQNLTQSVQNLSLSPEPKNGFTPTYAAPETPRRKAPQYDDSFSDSEDDERFYRDRRHMVEDRKYLPPPPHYRYPPSQRSVRSHPRRHNSEYFDFDDDEYDRHYESTSRRLRYRKPENIPRMARRRDYSPELSDEDFYDNPDGYRREYRRFPPSPDRYRSNASRLDDTESYYRGRNNRRPVNGHGSEMDFRRNPAPASRKPSPPNQNNSVETPATSNEYASEVEQRMPASARPPIKPLTRTMSINEAKQRHHVNLKSNIFHNDPEYDMIVEQRKPLSVREFAARQRVGVGLPDI